MVRILWNELLICITIFTTEYSFCQAKKGLSPLFFHTLMYQNPLRMIRVPRPGFSPELHQIVSGFNYTLYSILFGNVKYKIKKGRCFFTGPLFVIIIRIRTMFRSTPIRLDGSHPPVPRTTFRRVQGTRLCSI